MRKQKQFIFDAFMSLGLYMFFFFNFIARLRCCWRKAVFLEVNNYLVGYVMISSYSVLVPPNLNNQIQSAQALKNKQTKDKKNKR